MQLDLKNIWLHYGFSEMVVNIKTLLVILSWSNEENTRVEANFVHVF